MTEYKTLNSLFNLNNIIYVLDNGADSSNEIEINLNVFHAQDSLLKSMRIISLLHLPY